MKDFLDVIAVPLAELLRTVADYLDLVAEEGEEPEGPPAVFEPPLPRYRINSQGGLEAVD